MVITVIGTCKFNTDRAMLIAGDEYASPPAKKPVKNVTGSNGGMSAVHAIPIT